ncbi:MAG TPA: GMP synthase [Acidimicrobiia bacterium]|nr:GMP synthase [Acidimicrobiia bacterium]
MKLGLLLCDHVRPGFRAVAGDYPEFFARFFADRPDVELVEFDLTAGEFPVDLDQCDAWITTGSRHSVYEDVPWVVTLADLVRRFDRERRKLVGICFGAQMIGHALGGEVARAPAGWQVGIKETRVGLAQLWMVPAADTFRILHMNGDQILIPPERLRVLGSSEGVPVSVIAVGDHFIGFQGHPEFEPAYSAVLMEARRGNPIPEDVVDSGLSSLAIDTDTRLLSDWITRFIAG